MHPWQVVTNSHGYVSTAADRHLRMCNLSNRFVPLEDADETIKTGVPPEARREAPAAVAVNAKAKPAIAAVPAPATQPAEAPVNKSAPSGKAADAEAPPRAKVRSQCVFRHHCWQSAGFGKRN